MRPSPGGAALGDLTVLVRAVCGDPDDAAAELGADLPGAAVRVVPAAPEHWADVSSVNRLVDEAATELVLVVDADVRAERGTVLALVDHLRGTPGCGAAGANFGSGADRLLWRPRAPSDAWAAVRAVARHGGETEPTCFVTYRTLLSTVPLDPGAAPFHVLADLETRLGWRGYVWETVEGAHAHRPAAAASRIGPGDVSVVVAETRRYVGPRWPVRRLLALWARLMWLCVVSVLSGKASTGRAVWRGLGLSPAALRGVGFESPVRRLRRLLGRAKQTVVEAPGRLGLRARRRRFLWRARRQARRSRATVELRVARDVDLAGDVRIEFHPGAHARLTIGSGVVIQAGGIVRLGGECVIGARSQLRYGVVLNAKGTLVLAGRNVLGRGTMVHADGDMTWEWGASCAEYVSVLDSHHEMDGTLPHVHDHRVVQSQTVIGASSLLGAHVTVLPGVALGRGCLVGAGSVLTRSTPDGVILAGVPAKVLNTFAQVTAR